MPYTPSATDVTNPTDTGIKASTAPAEFRAVKTYLAGTSVYWFSAVSRRAIA